MLGLILDICGGQDRHCSYSTIENSEIPQCMMFSSSWGFEEAMILDQREEACAEVR